MSTLKIRRTGGRYEWDQAHQVVMSLALLIGYSTFDRAGIANGATAGKLKTAAQVSYRIEGAAYTKAAADDLWDLSGEDETPEDAYRAYWLLLDATGAASIAGGADAATAEDALAALPALDGTKAVIGVYLADPETDFTAALAAQGTIYDGIPEGAPLRGLPGRRYIRPPVIELGGF